ncbi:MAG: phosphopantetheine-binding protein, partial [Cyanobacteria bacterium P01_A01_bin.40]
MGLDAVELLIKIEERFQTYIPDFEAEKITTVGELHYFLMQRIRRRDLSSCLTASIFYSIRQI